MPTVRERLIKAFFTLESSSSSRMSPRIRMAAAHTIAPARADKRFHRSEISFVHLRHALDIGLSTRLQSNNRVAISIALKVYPRAAKALRLMGSAARLHVVLAACQGHPSVS